MRILLFLILIIAEYCAFAQFPPAAGQDGSTAIYADSVVCTGWASSCTVVRGWVDISDTTLGKVSFGTEADATGKADNTPVSLGDGGSAVVTFDSPVTNGPGPDFAVFENALNDSFLELAFVEVSSDGQYYVRFPSVSLTPADTQTSAFGLLETTLLHNLAGKYRAMYGTPFDLDDVPDDALLDKSRITHIRIIDVVGSVLPELATYDSQGNIINDPWPTPFNTGGFDLDAVAIVNCNCQAGKTETNQTASIYPNPADSHILISTGSNDEFIAEILTLNGKKIATVTGTGSVSTDVSSLEAGLYLIHIISNRFITSHRLIKR